MIFDAYFDATAFDRPDGRQPLPADGYGSALPSGFR